MKVLIQFGILFFFVQIPFVAPSQKKLPNNYEAYAKDMEDMYIKNPIKKGYKIWKRREWFWRQRMMGQKEMINPALQNLAAYDTWLREYKSNNRATHGAWVSQGPTENASGLGRINCIAIHPTDANIIYVATASGGVWKTTDGGTNWVNKTPHIPILQTTDIRISPQDPNTLFLLTGDAEPLPVVGSPHTTSEFASIGILKSTDAGNTWTATPFSFAVTQLLRPLKLMIHPTNENIQYVASHDGLFRTGNQWNSHDTIIFGTVYDIEFKPDNPNIVYAAGENWIKKSTNGGFIFNDISDSDFSLLNASCRVDLEVSPDNPNIVYAVGGCESLAAVLLSITEGSNNSWIAQSSNYTPSTFGGQGWYNMNCKADPNDWSKIYVAMVNMWKSNDAGVTFSSVMNSIHVDFHDLVIRDGVLYAANDGGIYKSNNEGASWTNITKGIQMTEFYSFSMVPGNADLILAGAQDNGTLLKNTAGTVYQIVNGGDGMDCAINPNDPTFMIASSQNGNFSRSYDGGNIFWPIAAPGAGAWLTPLELHKGVPSTCFIGKTTISRVDNAANTIVTLGSPETFPLNCLAHAPSNQNRIYLSRDSFIYYTDQALSPTNINASFTNIGNGLANLFITSIAVNPSFHDQIFVTLSGYNATNKVYVSNNSGVTWGNITYNLPNVPANCIQYYNNPLGQDALFVGTDIGVFCSKIGTTEWIYYSNFLPPTVINKLFIDYVNNTITAATFGRGIWRSPIQIECDNNIVLTEMSGGIKYYSASDYIFSQSNYPKDIGNEVSYVAGNYITLSPGFEAGGFIDFDAVIGPCPLPYEQMTKTIDEPPFSTLYLSNEDVARLNTVLLTNNEY